MYKMSSAEIVQRDAWLRTNATEPSMKRKPLDPHKPNERRPKQRARTLPASGTFGRIPLSTSTAFQWIVC